ncbi:hypothetical protein [Clostridioides difficile]|uniref:hypothetical protein n=1 Tax=Clostridioides difficile TaxID=1496 RepID=UPI001C191FBE|nr:hypothetical protein [Clostridioides difficile]HBF0430266.1 hypothetical protein [Clostridioides difficile]HBG3623776.1 hypothetical protein [Clostridioides difficile]
MIYKDLLKKIDDIENLKEIDNIKCTTDTGEYTIENSKKGYLTNFNIEGKTLVNLANPNNIYVTDGVRYNNPFRYIENGKAYTFMNLCDKQIKYTYGGIGDITIPAKSKVLYTIPITNITISEVMCYGHTTDGWEETDADKQKISKAMLVLEGDYTGEDIEYFDGLQSVGQGNNIELLSYKNDGNLFDGEFRNGSYIDDGSFYADNNATSNKNFIRVDGNKKYSINYDLDIAGKIFEYDKNKKYIKNTSITNVFSFTTSENTKYINFFIGTNSVGYSPGIKFMFNVGEIKEYERYKFDKKTIPYTLRSLPSGIKDSIIYKNNGHKLIQRCEEITLNGQENWIQHGNSNDKTLIFYAKVTEGSYNNSDNIELKCNRFKGIRIITNTFTEEGIYENKDGNVYIRILKGKLNTQDLNGFKMWLNNNNVTFIRQLKEIKEIKLVDLGLKTFENESRFVTNAGNIIPTMNFEVTQNFGNNIEILKSKINTLENMYTYSKTIDLSDKLLNGWKKAYDIHQGLILSKLGNVVQISSVIKDGLFTTGTIIVCLPKEFTPNKIAPIQVFDSGESLGSLEIRPEGYIKIAIVNKNSTRIIFNGSYILE